MTVIRIPTPSPEKTKLIKTTDFSLGSYKYETFNYLQTIYYPHHTIDQNTIIAATTSAGKTVCAEITAQDVITNKKKKVIYLCPLKALSQEKFDDWTNENHYLSKNKIEILTGDSKLTPAKAKSLKDSDLIIMTSEMLDTRTRFHNSEPNQWLMDVGLVIADEAHLLTTSRGPALEVGLMRFAEINPSAKLLLLSATMTNYKEIAKWVHSLNGKKTATLFTDWRPVSLHIHKHTNKNTLHHTSNLLKILTCPTNLLAEYAISPIEEERDYSTIRGLGGINNIKTLCFVHTKSDGKKLVDMLRAQGMQAEFHNADLNKETRNKLERSFREDLDILVATSTLAWGVNLPAKNVIVVGERRGSETVSPIDIAQMAGRAGRFGMYDRGDVFLVNCNVGQDFSVKSQLLDCLAFHLVAEIHSSNIKVQSDAVRWFSRSFKYSEDPKTSNVVESLNKLVDCKAIKINEQGHYETTYIGKIARDLYLDPFDVASWDMNFKTLNLSGKWSESIHFARALTNNVKILGMDYTPAPTIPYVNVLKNQLMMNQLKISSSAHTYGSLIYHRLELSKFDKFARKNFEEAYILYLQTLLKDISRVFSAIKRLSTHNKWKKSKEIDAYQIRLTYGVGHHLVDLITIPGVGAVIAEQLFAAGLRTKKDVIENKDKLGDYIKRKANVTRILEGLKILEEGDHDELVVDF